MLLILIGNRLPPEAALDLPPLTGANSISTTAVSGRARAALAILVVLGLDRGTSSSCPRWSTGFHRRGLCGAIMLA